MPVTYFAVGKTPRVDRRANIGDTAFFDCHGQITIGPWAFLGHEVMILTGTHNYMLLTDKRIQTCLSRPVVIHEGAWICSRAIICPGVTVGAYAVVGPGAVVMRNVAPYTVVAGNPARFIRRLRAK